MPGVAPHPHFYNIWQIGESRGHEISAGSPIPATSEVTVHSHGFSRTLFLTGRLVSIVNLETQYIHNTTQETVLHPTSYRYSHPSRSSYLSRLMVSGSWMHKPVSVLVVSAKSKQRQQSARVITLAIQSPLIACRKSLLLLQDQTDCQGCQILAGKDTSTKLDKRLGF